MRNRKKLDGSDLNNALVGGACLVAVITLGLCTAPTDAKAQNVARNAAVATVKDGVVTAVGANTHCH